MRVIIVRSRTQPYGGTCDGLEMEWNKKSCRCWFGDYYQQQQTRSYGTVINIPFNLITDIVTFVEKVEEIKHFWIGELIRGHVSTINITFSDANCDHSSPLNSGCLCNVNVLKNGLFGVANYANGGPVNWLCFNNWTAKMIKLTGSGLPISQYHSIHHTLTSREWQGEREREQRTELYGIDSTWGETPNIYFVVAVGPPNDSVKALLCGSKCI